MYYNTSLLSSADLYYNISIERLRPSALNSKSKSPTIDNGSIDNYLKLHCSSYQRARHLAMAIQKSAYANNDLRHTSVVSAVNEKLVHLVPQNDWLWTLCFNYKGKGVNLVLQKWPHDDQITQTVKGKKERTERKKIHYWTSRVALQYYTTTGGIGQVASGYWVLCHHNFRICLIFKV